MIACYGPTGTRFEPSSRLTLFDEVVANLMTWTGADFEPATAAVDGAIPSGDEAILDNEEGRDAVLKTAIEAMPAAHKRVLVIRGS